MDYDGMDQLTDMGFTRELAAQALAATGGKSTLKATEWILTHRNKSSSTAAAAAADHHHHHNHSPPVRGQVRVDHFFTASASKLHDHQTIEAEIPTPSLGQKNVAAVFRKTMADDHQQPRLLAISSDTPKQITSSLPQQNAQDVLPPPPAKRIKLEDPKQQQQQQQKSPFQPSTKKKLKSSTKSVVPLAERMRPSSIDDIVGQDHLLGSRGILRSLLENDSLASVIFWGPPGTGKTSLAKAIASHVSYRFTALSAVTSGVKEVREILEEAKKLKKYGQRTLLFLDEVHRFNKAQQDAFLPYVEAGHVVFIGATTENPSFEINAALLSRCKVLTLNKLQPADLKKLIERAIGDREKGVMVFAGNPAEVTVNLRVEDDAVSFLAGAADGDARAALNTLEIAVLAAASRFQKDGRSGNEAREDHAEMNLMVAPPPPGSSIKGVSSGSAGAEKKSFNILEVLKENVQHSQHEYTKPFKKFVGGKDVTVQAAVSPTAAAIAVDQSDQTTKERGDHAAAAAAEASEMVISVTFEDVKDALQRSHVFYDKSGEEHYNIISALHKSMRGGDPDAAIYWLARMIEGGEGPLFVARRLIRFASEDVGLADPQALPQAVACYQACHFLGMPECNVHLAQCVVYLALAPKSIAVYQAIEAAQKYVREKGQNEAVPLHLRNAPTKLMKELGYSKGYIYPPAHKGAVEQEFMPPALRGLKFLPEL